MEQLNMFDVPQPGEPEPEPWQSLLAQARTNPPPNVTTIIRQNIPNLLLADKFETMADAMQPAIDGKMAERQTNTVKRQGQAMTARADGERLKRTQQALRALASRHRAGTCPASLCDLKSKKAVHDLTRAEMQRIPNGFHEYMHDTGKPCEGADAQSLELWSMLAGKTEEEERAEEVDRMVMDLQFSKIPGYFETPPAVIAQMIEAADIYAGMSVLEPSAGSGAIAAAVDALPENPLVVVYEINPTLCEILRAKGFDAHPVDFMQETGKFEFDRVLMNPPFEKGQDVEHVRRAFGRLSDLGRLVSVMSPGPFFRTDERSTEFRKWFDELGGEVVDLPDGSFKSSGTNVSTKLVIIDKG